MITGIPASSAFWATGVSASPSWGRTTSASGSSEIACSICWAWESESAASSSWKSTSSYWSAAAWAFFEIAPSQPWSVGGTLATIETVSPEPPPESPPELDVSVAGAVTVVVSSPPHAATPSARIAAVAIEIESRFSDMGYLSSCGS